MFAGLGRLGDRCTACVAAGEEGEGWVNGEPATEPTGASQGIFGLSACGPLPTVGCCCAGSLCARDSAARHAAVQSVSAFVHRFLQQAQGPGSVPPIGTTLNGPTSVWTTAHLRLLTGCPARAAQVRLKGRRPRGSKEPPLWAQLSSCLLTPES